MVCLSGFGDGLRYFEECDQHQNSARTGRWSVSIVERRGATAWTTSVETYFWMAKASSKGAQSTIDFMTQLAEYERLSRRLLLLLKLKASIIADVIGRYKTTLASTADTVRYGYP